MKYILTYSNGEKWEDFYRYDYLIDGDSIESIKQKVVDAFVEAVNTDDWDMVVDGYLYPVPQQYSSEVNRLPDFEIITVEDYIKTHMPTKAK